VQYYTWLSLIFFNYLPNVEGRLRWLGGEKVNAGKPCSVGIEELRPLWKASSLPSRLVAMCLYVQISSLVGK
jgi:hypothetical protein